MYSDGKFIVKDLAEIRGFVEKYPFATVVATDAGGRFVATHVPLLVECWDERVVFRGHVMRGTDHGDALVQAANVFVSFLGPDAPVLGSWQLTPRFGGTWNYQAVHVRGSVREQGTHTLVAHLEKLKDRFETSPKHGFSSLPPGYVDSMVPMIQCIDIVVADMECIFKLGQNRQLEEFDRTVDNLARLGGKPALVAGEMQARRGEYFPGAR